MNIKPFSVNVPVTDTEINALALHGPDGLDLVIRGDNKDNIDLIVESGISSLQEILSENLSGREDVLLDLSCRIKALLKEADKVDALGKSILVSLHINEISRPSSITVSGIVEGRSYTNN